jgi:hypothetical protein
MIETNNVSRPMVIEFDASEVFDIERPNWCPIHGINSTPNSQPMNDSESTKEEEAVETVKSFKEMTWLEKKDEFKKLPRKIEWSEIKVDGYYLIPRILSTPRKIIHVTTKTETCISYHEVSEVSGTEYSYTSTMYPNDAEAVLIVELHNF